METQTADQNSDLMFGIEKLVFATGSGTAVLDSDYDGDARRYSQVYYSNETVEVYPVANVKCEASYKDADSGSQRAYAQIISRSTTDLEQPMILNDYDALKIRLTLENTNRDVAPLVDLEKNSVVLVQNIVNDLGLVQSGVVLQSGGSTYATAPAVSISGGGGSGATAHAIVSGGAVTSVVVDNAGRGYTSAPTFSLSGGGGAGATVVYEGFETDSHGGNALARYMTRRITLADDFETNHARVWVDANLPGGTEIEVYAKFKSVDDPTAFDLRPWVKFGRVSDAGVNSDDPDQFTEMSFEPVGKTLSYSFGGVTYTQSKQIAFKIVMRSQNEARVPRLRDFRAITTINQ
jgi:hypothetical protein